MKKFIILIPVYNDWQSVFKLLNKIDLQVIKWDAKVSILIVNDASTDQRPEAQLNFKKIESVRVMNMKKNQGHARCYASGLKFLSEKEDFDYLIPMDGDGEDRPEELDLLFKKSIENPSKTVTANRVKRSEGSFFKLMYLGHKFLTFVFTGKFIKFGNYSCLPRTDVDKLIKEPHIWSSFSGSITKVISERTSVPSIRGQRYFGPSKMNFFNLLLHSIAIISVFKKSVIFRSLLFLIFYLFFISNNFSFITFFPAFVIIIFLFFVIKISLRANIKQLNNYSENIDSINSLSSSNHGQ